MRAGAQFWRGGCSMQMSESVRLRSLGLRIGPGLCACPSSAERAELTARCATCRVATIESALRGTLTKFPLLRLLLTGRSRRLTLRLHAEES
jgi:hypothetical protein